MISPLVEKEGWSKRQSRTKKFPTRSIDGRVKSFSSGGEVRSLCTNTAAKAKAQSNEFTRGHPELVLHIRL
jgi:hypothetical protein